MDIFFEICQHVLKVPTCNIVIPKKEQMATTEGYRTRHYLSSFWQIIFSRKQTEPRFSDVCFQFYMYMSAVHLAPLAPSPSPSSKLQQFFKMLENVFYSLEFRDKMLSVFCKSQRTYYALGSFARQWKMNRAPVVVEYDLSLTPIDRTKCRQYTTIYQNGAVYMFRIGDLINIVETALCHCCSEFFVDSYSPRNPFTNEPFSDAILLVIYNRIRQSLYRMPVLFELFFREIFNLPGFVYKYEGIIRERYIERLLQFGDVENLSQHIRKMLRYVRVFPHLDPGFPKQQLVHIFRPYLSFYFCHLFSTIYGEKKDNSYNVLCHQLHRLMNYNPRLGRRIILRKTSLSYEDKQKLHLKYIVTTLPAEDVGFIEVFSIDHLPLTSTSTSTSTDTFFSPSDEDDEDDEEARGWGRWIAS